MVIRAKRRRTLPRLAARFSAMKISGKLVIVAILAFALAAAGASWWFRYNATHRAAKFWGPDDARRIRDAPFVELYYINDDPDALSTIREISKAPGLTHLRHALL